MSVAPKERTERCGAEVLVHRHLPPAIKAPYLMLRDGDSYAWKENKATDPLDCEIS